MKPHSLPHNGPSLELGWSQRPLAVKEGMPMAGYACSRYCKEIKDPLFASVLVWKNDDMNDRQSIGGIIALDLVGFDDTLMHPIRAMLESMDLNADSFLVSATHTHTGPAGTFDSQTGILAGTQELFGLSDPLLVRSIVQTIQDALSQAVNHLSQGTLTSFGLPFEIGKNRNDPSLPGYPKIQIVKAENRHGTCLFVYGACHPTTAGVCESISADFCGVLNQLAKDSGYDFAAYINGPCGDISTRYTRKLRGFEETQRVGALLWKAVEQSLSQESTADYPASKAISSIECKGMHPISLRLKQPEDLEQAQKQLEAACQNIEQWKAQMSDLLRMQGRSECSEKENRQLRALESLREGAWAKVQFAKSAKARNMDVWNGQVQIWKANDTWIVAVPGEMFSQLSNPMEMTRNNIRIVGYANGYAGYFPDGAAYESRTYEALASPYDKDSVSTLPEQIEAILDQIEGQEARAKETRK